MASKKNGNSAGVKKSLPPVNTPSKGTAKKLLGTKKGGK